MSTNIKKPKAKKSYSDSYYARFNVKRPAAWRYEQAFAASNGRVLPRNTKMDPQVKKLRTYLIRKRSISNKLTEDQLIQMELAERYGPLWNAESIYLSGEDDVTRYTMEAMLLANMSDEEIANHHKCDTDTVRIYESCFYNVRDALSSRRYIANVILPPIFMSGLGNRTPELVCKYFGYFGGPQILSVMMDGIEMNPAIPKEGFQVGRWLDEQFRVRFRAVAVVGATFMEPTSFTLRTLLEGFNQLLSLTHREQAEVGDDNVLSQAIEVFVRGHDPPVGDDASEIPTIPGQVYANGIVEPRVDDLVAIASGREPASLASFNDDEFENPFDRNKQSAEDE